MRVSSYLRIPSPGAGNVAKWYSQDITDQRAVLHSDQLLRVDAVLNEQIS